MREHRPRWDIFCAVVDYFGDIGTCWRLALQLAEEHEVAVRLWVDNLESFARLSPALATDVDVQHVGPVEVRHWPADFSTVDLTAVDVADVVIEAFACEIPESYVAAMAQRAVAPVWLNLEYLSAEDWVEGSHQLPSPHWKFRLTKYFYFPGFTARTGGLLRERGLLAARAAFDAAADAAFWSTLNVPSRTDNDELRVSLFCYDNAAVPELLQCWAEGPGPVRVLSTPGPATDQVSDWCGETLSPGTQIRRKSLTLHALPFLPPPAYDRLLWACDVNFVRGEDSFVRAQWAQRPFVWQIYPQTENIHLVKLAAFLRKYVADFEKSKEVQDCWQAWNGLGDMAVAWRNFVAQRQVIEQHGQDWVRRLEQQRDLANNLVCFVDET